MEQPQNQSFQYTYCAAEQEEIRAILDKYTPPAETEDKLTRLRKLDAAVTHRASITALILGILGALIMGSGMSLIMTDLSSLLNLDTTLAIGLGLGAGLLGMLLVTVAYPVYNRIVKTDRKRLAPEILRLASELTK